MQKLGTGTSIERGWQIVSILKESTKQWKPSIAFVLVLPSPDKVEIWAWGPVKKDEEKWLKHVMRDYVEGK